MHNLLTVSPACCNLLDIISILNCKMYINIVRLFLQANAYNQLSSLKPTIIRILESKHGPTYWIIEHADKMVKKTEQTNGPKIQSKHSLEEATKHFSNSPLSKSHNFVTFIFLFCDKDVSVHVASALFSLTKSLNYWIMVKQGPKLQFNCYNIKTDTCVFHFTDIF